MEASRREVIGWVTAAGLVLAGVVTLLVVSSLSTDFGYAGPPPLLGGGYIPGAFGLTHTLNALAAGVLVLGLTANGFMAGLWVGRTSRPFPPRKELISWIAAVGLITAGLLAVNRPPTSFGWFAYAPLTDTTYMPGASPATLALTALGVILLVLGLLTTGLLTGVRVRREGPASSRGMTDRDPVLE